MHTHPLPTLTPADVVRIMRRRWVVWLLPAVVGGLMTAAYLRWMPFPWQASQTLLVRNESVNIAPDGPGRFRQENEMKTTQETIMEVARSRSVVAEALESIGPPEIRKSTEPWPSEEEIADAQVAIQVVPPKGTEFGKSELFYVRVKDRERTRAVMLTAAICDRLEAKLSQVRGSKAASIVEELDRNVQVAEKQLDDITRRLAQVERQVGGRDLADLRMLDQTSNGDSDLRRNLTTVEAELRDARHNRQIGLELITVLREALKDHSKLVATPNRLLDLQPALRKLKDGLLDSQLRTAQMLGSFKPDHPQVKAAMLADQEIRQQLQDELSIAVRGLEVELRVAASRIAMLEQQLTNNNGRLDGLAGLRAEYSNLIAAARHQNSLVERARKDLADARGTQAAAANGSLISRIDVPSTGPRPVGPRRLIVVLAGVLAGIAVGCGYLFLSEPVPAPATGRSLATVMPSRMTTIVSMGTYCAGERGLSFRQALWKISQERSLTRTDW